MAPALTGMIIAGYGFLVWMLQARSDLWQLVEFSKRFKVDEIWPKELLDKKPEYRGKTHDGLR